MILSGLKIRLSLLKILLKITLKAVMKDIYLKLIFKILIFSLFFFFFFILQWFSLFARNNKTWKNWKICSQFAWQKNYVIKPRNLKQSFNNGLILQRVHRVIKCNQKAWLKPSIDMNSQLTRKFKKWFKKIFF